MMKAFQNVLFPVDLSETSAKMVPFVTGFLKEFSSGLHLLFVVRDLDYFTDFQVSQSMIADFKQTVFEGAESSLQEFRDGELTDWDDVRTSVRSGDITDQIRDYAKIHHNDLLILGTHGRKRFEKIVFGSIAEKVLKTVPQPILLVNPYRYAESKRSSSGPFNVNRILFPIDFSDITLKVLPFVQTVAEAFDAEVTIVSVTRSYSYFGAMTAPDHTIQSFEREIMGGRARMLDEFRSCHFNGNDSVSTKSLSGDVSEEILAACDSGRADLIIMGTHGRRGVKRVVFGSVAERVSKSAPVPVLLIKP